MPNRTPLRLKDAADEQPFRHHDCRFYGECLSVACSGRWESWSCTGCFAFEPAARLVLSTNRGQDY